MGRSLELDTGHALHRGVFGAAWSTADPLRTSQPTVVRLRTFVGRIAMVHDRHPVPVHDFDVGAELTVLDGWIVDEIHPRHMGFPSLHQIPTEVQIQSSPRTGFPEAVQSRMA